MVKIKQSVKCQWLQNSYKCVLENEVHKLFNIKYKLRNKWAEFKKRKAEILATTKVLNALNIVNWKIFFPFNLVYFRGRKKLARQIWFLFSWWCAETNQALKEMTSQIHKKGKFSQMVEIKQCFQWRILQTNALLKMNLISIICQSQSWENHSALIGSFSVGILQYGPFPWKPCIFVSKQSRQIHNLKQLYLKPKLRKKSEYCHSSQLNYQKKLKLKIDVFWRFQRWMKTSDEHLI